MSARGVLGDLKRCTRKSEPYDSTWERDYMMQMDADETVKRWERCRSLRIPYVKADGTKATYNPDFIVETAERKYVVEVKARNELVPVMDAEVRAKAQAAERWCAEASKLPGSKSWEYKLVPDDAVKTTLSLAFIISQAIRADRA